MDRGPNDQLARPPGAVLLYDEDCGMCRYLAAKLLAWDRRRTLRPVPIQGREGDRLLGEIDPEMKLASWHLVEPDGSVYSGGRAFPPVFRRLPGAAPLARLTARAPRLTERAYRLVAGNRGRIGPLIPARAKARADRRLSARRHG